MALPFGDNVHTTFFTPKEYQVELLEAAREDNIIACIENVTTKTFVSSKLIQELATIPRKNPKKSCALFVVESSQNAVHYGSAIKHLSGLKLVNLMPQTLPFGESIVRMLSGAQVILANSAQSWELISSSFIVMEQIYLLIVDDCHYSTIRSHLMHKLMNSIRPSDELRIFGMMFPLYTMSNLSPGKMEADLNYLQNTMHCRVETASDVVSILRYNCKPMEYLVECDIREKDDLDELIRAEVKETVNFLQEHRFDPSETYDGDLLEELRSVPDPATEPLNIIHDFVDIFNTMGAWCANKAALSSLFIIEKLKLKTPYERNYLLLCVVSSLMLKIRTIFEEYFSQYSENEQVYKFISPKVHTMIKILHRYKPSKRPGHEIVTEEEDNDRWNSGSVKQETAALDTDDRNTCETNEPNEYLTTPLTICDSYIKYKNDKANRWKNKKKYQNKQPVLRSKVQSDDEVTCCVIFVKSRLVATIIHYLLSDLKKFDNEKFWWVSPQFTPEKTADPEKEPRDAEVQHRNLEEVLRKFRTRDCNILIGISMLEEGIDLPKCNLVIRFDTPRTFRSYVYSKSKANANNAHFFMMYELPLKNEFINDLSVYYAIEQLLLKRCSNKVESAESLREANQYSESVIPYSPFSQKENNSYVSLDNAIACVNRYCAKLPSDSFTRLTPMWTTESFILDDTPLYVTTIRLPINSPYKKEIRGHPMPSKILSKRVAALEACRLLHKAGELDQNLQPIGKENFHLLFLAEDVSVDEADQFLAAEENDPRPGTNKRRQYYRRKIANCLAECRPTPQTPLYLYNIKMVLSCPLPEEQNTRGRRLYPPEESPTGFGILLTKKIPKVCPFPIFIRCGEVIVSLELCTNELYLSQEQLKSISTFLDYTFSKVLKLNKYFMAFDMYNASSTYFIVPTITNLGGHVFIDWEFLKRIYQHKEGELVLVPDHERTDFKFNKELYDDAVVMPWYRNREFPQHFYVAEICCNLSPRSQFPGVEYKTFEEYYFRKYHFKIQNLTQPLLDVDHTSARLNFLTPRYVNRKGVALPTCSEATKKAKRESLEQKQILVPELCQIHLFPASLWRKAVALPCILYRLNCLLLAEEIRGQVSREIKLGVETVPDDYDWPPLNFGWTLADVVRRTRELKEVKAHKDAAAACTDLTNVDKEFSTIEEAAAAAANACTTNYGRGRKEIDARIKDEKNENENACKATNEGGEPLLEIGMWSNDMASTISPFTCDLLDASCGTANEIMRYGSPTSWSNNDDDDDDYYMDVDSLADSESSLSYTENATNATAGIRIEFRNEFLAEAIDRIDQCKDLINVDTNSTWQWEGSAGIDDSVKRETEQFEDAVLKIKQEILTSGRIIEHEGQILIKPYPFNVTDGEKPADKKTLPWLLSPEHGYGMPPGAATASLVNVHDSQVFDSRRQDLCESLDTCHIAIDDSCCLDGNDEDEGGNQVTFSFDYQPDLQNHVGPAPSVLLQALTMSNANDGINLERLETIGDSFLKYAITNYLYCTYDNVHEGKLSHIRSKQVSNLHLYKLGKKKVFGECMVACKFEPHDNWLPPCFQIPIELEKALLENNAFSCYWKVSDLPVLWNVKHENISFTRKTKLEVDCGNTEEADLNYLLFRLITYHSIPDKSIADCVEALIGAYLIACGIRGAMLFMSWLGIKVLPVTNGNENKADENSQVEYAYLYPPPSPLIRNVTNPEAELKQLMVGYDEFERILRYRFHDRSYLLQAMTHASYSPNRITDCYQRLEFLGDAVLDYLITRHLYEDKRQHSPGALTDLRSALVNNTIFAALAVRFGFHKYFRHLSPGLADVIHRFVRIQEHNNHTIFEEYYLINEEECEDVEDVEVPKALGDIFESVAGAIFLDSEMSLDAVWRVYYRIMKNEIEQFSTNVPKSPIRELLEREPETAKFGRPEKLADGKRVRVTVEVFGKGSFKGIGRNYRIAKCTAAKCALKQLKKEI